MSKIAVNPYKNFSHSFIKMHIILPETKNQRHYCVPSPRKLASINHFKSFRGSSNMLTEEEDKLDPEW